MLVNRQLVDNNLIQAINCHGVDREGGLGQFEVIVVGGSS